MYRKTALFIFRIISLLVLLFQVYMTLTLLGLSFLFGRSSGSAPVAFEIFTFAVPFALGILLWLLAPVLAALAAGGLDRD
jgi:hypothetical protein